MIYHPESMLEGQPNARDLGGIKAAGGRVIAPGRIIRSGQLSALTAGDVEYLRSIGLSTVVDFRTEQERREKPDRLPDGVRQLWCPVVGDLVPGITRESIEDPYTAFSRAGYAGELGAGGKEKMRSLYPILVDTDSAVRHYSRFFGFVLENDGALLFHCTMGKDRAGVAAALLLYALGASTEDILSDYMYTGICCADAIRRMTDECREFTDDENVLESVFWLNTTDESYLAAMFDRTAELFGSTDAYLENALGLTPEKKEKLRDKYLTK